MSEARLLAKIVGWLDGCEPDAQQRVMLFLISKYGLPAVGELGLSTAPRSAGATRMERYRRRQRGDETSPSVTPRDVTERHGRDVTSDAFRTVVDLDSVSKNGTTGATKKQDHKKEATEVLEFLNQKTGRSFRPVGPNLDLISARMASGASLSDCKGVIARKVREWKDDEKMRGFLRPETLFNKTKFESYLGQREAVTP